MTNNLREQLLSIAGLSPSHHWLAGCTVALPQNASTQAVVEQVLHADLRDVVRTFQNNDNISAAAQQLRRAVQQSLSAEQGAATLPESFRLMVQVEECADISCNTDARYSSTDANNSHANNRNSKRCLKLAYSDGYSSAGSSLHTQNAETSPLLVAVELSLIPGLSNSNTLLAGTKVVLSGPMIIRRGIAGWTAGNALVLGGSVQSLVECQTTAMAAARLKAGVGIDPTVRALISSDDYQGEENDEEEDQEGPSGNVPRPPPPPQQHQQRPQPFPPPQSRNQMRQQAALPPPPRQQQQQQRQSNATIPNYQQQVRPASNPYASSSSLSTPATSAPSNPYASSTTAAGSQVVPTPVTSFLPDNQRRQAPHNQRGNGAAAANPYHSAPQSQRRTTTSNSTTTTTTAAAIAANAKPSNAAANPYRQSLSQGSVSAPSTTSASNNNNALSLSPPPPQNMPAPTPVLEYSYAQLLDLVKRAVSDQAVYRHAFGKVYAVQLKQSGLHLHFNIEKIKPREKKRKKGAKQYGWVMVVRCGGDSDDANGLVTCKVSNSILEPHFPMPPAEMKTLSKQDKARSDAAVSEGGRSVKQSMTQLGCYEVTLLLTPEEFFQHPKPTIDGDKPVLCLLKRRG